MKNLPKPMIVPLDVWEAWFETEVKDLASELRKLRYLVSLDEETKEPGELIKSLLISRRDLPNQLFTLSFSVTDKNVSVEFRSPGGGCESLFLGTVDSLSTKTVSQILAQFVRSLKNRLPEA